MNIILGPNAQGKSNLLEALFLFTTGKSFRALRELELIEWGESFSRLTLELIRKNQEKINLELYLQKGKNNRRLSKIIKINNNIARSASDLAGTLNAVMFSPDDMEIIKGPPGARRRFVDLQSTQISSSYCNNLRNYYRVLEQRNSLLRSFKECRESIKLLDVWDEQLAAYGVFLISERLGNLKKLQELTNPILIDITKGKEKLELLYCCSINIKGKRVNEFFYSSEKEDFEKTLKENMIEQLRAIRPHEFRKKATCIGPHRDDLQILINDRPLKNFGSQGQQRTVALSLKLAERELLYDMTGEEPLLLLDDITSELDEERSSKLLNYITGKGQIFLTRNQLAEFLKPLYENAFIIHVYGGTVELGVFH